MRQPEMAAFEIDPQPYSNKLPTIWATALADTKQASLQDVSPSVPRLEGEEVAKLTG
jgi:hypothetical protein